MAAAALSRGGSGRMYSWWWDSHISPKNSRWLQENLTDMDSKVKSMIKLIEEDADSFARRAEMYYKKRPELMKLVEEFYRAYRALAERYDHATGVIRQAQKTMVEAFPNQAPFMLGDDSTPDMSATPIPAFLEPHDDLPLSEESDSPVVLSRKGGLKHPGDPSRLKDFSEGRVRKGLKFDERSVESDETDVSQEILLLKKALAEVKAQKDAGLIQYQQSLVKLSILESEVTRAQENSRELSEKAAIAESEAQALKETLMKFEAEKEASLEQYRKSLNQISEMENTNTRLQEETDQLMAKATKAETEAQTLREEKDTALNQYMSSLEMISNLEHKLQNCEDDAKNFKERVEKAENEVETLKQHISKLIEEKDAAVVKYEKCMVTISSLEHELDSIREEAHKLNVEIDNRSNSLKNAEERCIELEKTNQTLHAEVEALMVKMGGQSQDLTEKQKELGRLWACIQEERLRFVEAETAFQTLQHLHAQAQDELRRLGSDLQEKVQSLKNMETHNKTLKELNESSSLTIQQLANEVSGLKETKGKLEEEVELRVDQRNALQQEIYCLKEELNVLNKQHSSVMEQVHGVGLSHEHLGSSVKELQDENTSLKETCVREANEKVALLEKVLILDQLLEKNSVLETSLADLNAELEALREKIEALEESYRSLSDEKSVLIDELETANGNLQKISQENVILENSLSDAHGEIEDLTKKSGSLEDSLKLLVNQKAIIASDRDSLTSELVSTQVRLDNLEKIYSELGEKYSALKDEKESSLCKIEELNMALDLEKKERAQSEQLNKNEMKLLLEELEHTKEEYDKEWQNAFESQTEIYMLRKSAQDLEEKNVDLLNKNHRLLETSESLRDLFTGLKQDYLNQESEMKSVSQKARTLRMGVFDFFKAFDDVDGLDHEFVDRCEDHHLSNVSSKLGATQRSIYKSEEEKFLLSNELSLLVTLLHELKIDAENLAVDLQKKLTERDEEKEVSRIQMFDLRKKLTDLQRENIQGLEVRGSMEGKIRTLEEENHLLCMEVLSLEVLSVIYRNGVDDKSKELKAIDEDNFAIKQRLNLTEMMLNDKGFELQQLREEHEKARSEREASVEEEINTWEKEATKVFDEMQVSNIHKILYEQKLRELADACQRLDGENKSKGFELQQLREEHEKAHSEREILVQEEINTWENEATKVFDEMQVSNIYRILYEQKLREVADACQRLDGEIKSKESSINVLNESVGALTNQNGNLNAQLAAYGPPIASLKQSILSLEKRSTLEPKDVEMHENTLDSSSVIDPLSDLQDLQRRIQSIEKAVIEREHETLNVHSELESAMKQITELKSDINLRSSRRRPISGMSELTKDIMLDQVSESSPYGSSKREANHSNTNDSQILESWEIIDKEDGSIDLKTSNKNNNPNKEISPVISKQSSFNRTRSLKKQRSTNNNSNRFGSDLMMEKELGIDKLEISKRFVESSQPQEGGAAQKKKVLERLNSDIQKLANLQITVEDLKRKLKVIRSSKKGKPMDECEILKEQLEEADANILKLFDQNTKLLKNVPPTTSPPEESETILNKGRRNSEQARRMSEKIGRIQMEVQKIQFVLLKLDIENDTTKGKNTKKDEARRRVLLKDYLYGNGVRSAYNKKKASFCCIRPQTEEN